MQAKEQQHDAWSWRGSPGVGDDPLVPDRSSAGRRERILLAVEAAGNRGQLLRRLQKGYEIVHADNGDLPEETFDLAILDAAGFRQWHATLGAIKRNTQPVFLPVMLILSKIDLERNLRTYWTLADEFLVSPINPGELSHRTEILLRVRRLSLAQRSHLAYLVHHDQSTGLPNEALFADRLRQAVRDATLLSRKLHVAVVQVNLEQVVESLGTRGKEEVARTFSAQLKEHLGEENLLARVAPDQWAFILSRTRSVRDVLNICNRVQSLKSVPISAGSEHVHIPLRIGVANYPDDAPDGESLLDRAIAALSQGEESSSPAFYSPAVQRRALHHIRTEAGLRAALEIDQFEQWLQPKVRLNDREVIGAEALVRWRLPTGELVPPNDFIPVAESTGLIEEIDRVMLGKACDFIRRLQRNHGAVLPRVAVNVSGVSVASAEFISAIEDEIARAGIAPELLELEITETAAVALSAENLASLAVLRDRGIRIALDDFGTGYCSLAYLHKLPITTVKIDRGFVSGLPAEENGVSITRAVVGLAGSLNLEVIAEGIETEPQADFLRRLGVEVGQGFLFSRPVRAQDFERLLLRGDR